MSTKINWLCPKCGAKGETISEGNITEPVTCTRCGNAADITAREEGDFNKFASAFHILPTDESAPLRWKCLHCGTEGSATLAQLASYQCYCPSCDKLLSPMDAVGLDRDLDSIKKEAQKSARGKIGTPEVSCSDCRTYSPTTVEAFMDDPTCPNCSSANCILHIPNAGTIKSGFFDGYVGFPDQKPMPMPECIPYDVTGIVAEREAPKPITESDPLDGFTAYKKGPLVSAPLSEADADRLIEGLAASIHIGDVGKCASIFSEAEQTINGPRAEDYGDANESFDKIAALWSAYLNTPVSPADVAMLMSLLKMVRLKYSKFAHHDSFVDLLGYVGLAHKVSGDK